MPLRHRVEHQLDHLGCDVDAVGNEFDDRLAPGGRGEGSGGRAPVAVVEGRHTVEQVRDERGATGGLGDGGERGAHLGGAGRGVPDRGVDAKARQGGDEAIGAGEFAAFGPLPVTEWRQSDGTYHIDVSHAEVTLAVLRLPD